MVPSHHFSLVPPRELKRDPPPSGGFFCLTVSELSKNDRQFQSDAAVGP